MMLARCVSRLQSSAAIDEPVAAMAEVGLIASVVQVAGAGLKLSQTLYQYAEGVTTAD